MAQTLIKRLRGILSSEVDDYFNEDDLLDYINEGYKSVISSAIKLETEQPEIGARSIRALDRLRYSETISLNPTDDYRTFKTADVDLDGLVDDVIFEKELYIGASVDDCGLGMSEISSTRKHKMDFGQLAPTAQQAYYEFVRDDEKSTLRTYFVDDSEVVLTIDFIAKPKLIESDDTELPELPDRLINAVVIKGALFGSTQEIRENRSDFDNLLQKEKAEHLW